MFHILTFLFIATNVASGADCSGETLGDTFVEIGNLCDIVEKQLKDGVFQSDDFCRCMVSIGESEVNSSLNCGVNNVISLSQKAKDESCYDRWQGKTFKVGDRVEAKWRAEHWYAGRISAVVGDDKYNVVYDDGDKDYDMPISLLKVLEEEQRSVRGDDGGYLLHEMVEACPCCEAYEINSANCVGQNDSWIRGIVRIAQNYPVLDSEGKGSYTIETDEGAVYQDVHYDYIRPLVVYTRGDFVEVRQCRWKEAVISNINPHGEYVVEFTSNGYPQKFVGKDIRIKMERYDPAEFVWAVNTAGDWDSAMIIQLNKDTDDYFLTFMNTGELRYNVPHTEICKRASMMETEPSPDCGR